MTCPAVRRAVQAIHCWTSQQWHTLRRAGRAALFSTAIASLAFQAAAAVANPLRPALDDSPASLAEMRDRGALQWRAPRLPGRAVEANLAPAVEHAGGGDAAPVARFAVAGDAAKGRVMTVQAESDVVDESAPLPMLPDATDPSPPLPAGDAPERSVLPPASRKDAAPAAPKPLPGVPAAQPMAKRDAYDCDDAWRDLNNKKLADISLDISVRADDGGQIPSVCTLTTGPFQPRDWDVTNFAWTASGLCHKPLYFEQVAMERYGHSTGPFMDPLVSGAHFFLSVPLLPYNMGLKGPQECEYALGYYRPGNCAPYMIRGFPITTRAVAAELGVATGLIFLLP